MTTRLSLAVGLVGAGRMGSFHAETLARRLPGVRLAAVADPAPGAARGLADRLDCATAYTEIGDLFADPAVDAVVIATPARTHADLVVAAARAGKAVYCEKPMATTLADADRAIAAAAEAGVPLQVGFNRRYDTGFRTAHDKVAAGAIGTPQLLRSLTRDPKLADPSPIPPWTIFLETLIHDFDTLRYLNPGARTGRGLRPGRRPGPPRLQGPRPARHGRRHDPLRQRRPRHRRGQLPGGVRL
ncbi:Gfo/Idh/MocA family oxidoreductase [Streptomyces sp. L7]